MKKGIISIISVIGGIVTGAVGVISVMQKNTNKKQTASDKYRTLFLMMNQWVRVKQEGKNLSSYFEKNGYNKIAVYGMSYAGEALIKEMEGTKVQVAYGIDQRANKLYSEVDIRSMDEKLEDVDAVVVTAITFFDEIENSLSKKVNCPIISLEDILYDI